MTEFLLKIWDGLAAFGRAVSGFFDGIAVSASGLDRKALAWGSVISAAVILLAVNLYSSSALRHVKADLTQDGLFSISEGTRDVLRSIDEPIRVQIYFSRLLGESAPSYARYFERVRSTLSQFSDISGGRLELTFINPEPFSDAEDRAVAAGLQAVRLNQAGDNAYFGLSATNSTDNKEVVAFFNPQRESFLEYDLTKLIYKLANPKKRAVGIISGLPIHGGMTRRGRTPAWSIVNQIREFFEVHTLDKNIKKVPDGIDTLMLVQPNGLTPDALYAIDQFALSGGNILLFLDPVSEMGRAGPSGLAAGALFGDFNKLLKTWGVGFDTGKGVGDIAHARRVQFPGGRGRQPIVTEYVVWVALNKSNIDKKDVLSGGIERINMATPGFITHVKGSKTKYSPILLSSARAMIIDGNKVRFRPDPVGLLRDYKPGGKQVALAARISGDVSSMYPDGPPQPKPKAKPKAAKKPAAKAKPAAPAKAKAPEAAKPIAKPATPAKGPSDKPPAALAKPKDPAAKAPPTVDKAKPAATPKPPAAKKPASVAKAAPAKPKKPKSPTGKPHVKSGKVNIIAVADTDMLHDQFWVVVRQFLGQRVMVPQAHNASFVLNALDNLSGGKALTALRGRGVEDRPFHLVDNIRRDAERRFRQKEQALIAKLKGVQAQLQKVEQKGDGNIILTEADKQAIEKFRREMISVRRQLRDVKHSLRRDIDSLDGTLKFINIAGVPLLIGIGGVAFGFMRRRRKQQNNRA